MSEARRLPSKFHSSSVLNSPGTKLVFNLQENELPSRVEMKRGAQISQDHCVNASKNYEKKIPIKTI